MNDKNMTKKVLGWLTRQGYPLEMRVATSLQKNGFEVRQADFYSDPEDKTYREIDIVATIPEYTGMTDVSFVIECKLARDKPWILFTSEHASTGWNRMIAYCIHSDSARRAIFDKEIETILSLPWMKKEGRVAHGITQAFTTGADVTYKASMGVLKAAISRKTELNKESFSPFVFIFPCIVIDGKLFECFIDNNGNLLVEEIKRGFYFFPLQIAGEVGTCIHVLTIEKLSEFIEEAKNVSESLISLLASDAKKKIKE